MIIIMSRHVSVSLLSSPGELLYMLVKKLDANLQVSFQSRSLGGVWERTVASTQNGNLGHCCH